MADLHAALNKEMFKHELFPFLLKLREELPTWDLRAQALNAEGIPTLTGKAWTRQNVCQLFKSYWRDRNGRYSWNDHKKQLETIQAALAA
jgi:hypothetical protein